MDQGIDSRVIKGKPVSVFESHNLALIPWGECRRALGKAPRLFTLDHHTDTHSAFVGAATHQPGYLMPRPEGVWEPIAQSLVDAIHFEDAESVAQAAQRLRYDEQIDAAVRSGILDIAFVAAHSEQGHIESDQQRALNEAWRSSAAFGPRPVAPPPFTYSLPTDRIVILPNVSLLKGRLMPGGIRGDKYNRDYCNAALEDELLQQHMKLADQICSDAGVPRLLEAPYVLDIDLDYFNTRRSIAPKHPAVFYQLVRHSAAVTVAKESECVKLCRLKGETKVTSEFLEKRLMEHLEAALR